MNRLINKRKSVINDFKFKNEKKDLLKLNFLNSVSATPVWISKKTGLPGPLLTYLSGVILTTKIWLFFLLL